MPKQRLQVGSGLRPASLTPSAAPVDTFVKTNAGSQLDQLANALSAISPSLARFSSVIQEEQQRGNEEQRVAGTKAFREQVQERKKTYDQAVKEGVIPRGANPFFVAGFKEQAGRVAADRWQTDMVVAAAGNEALNEATDLKAFDDFAAKHREEWIKGNVGENRDKFFEVGFGSRADAYLSDARRQAAAQVANRVEKMSDEAHFSEVKRHFRDNVRKGFSLEQVAADINQLNTDVVAHGRDGAAVNRTTVKAIAAAALEMASEGDVNARKYLGILKHITGKNGALADTTYGTEAVVKIGQEIDAQLWQANEHEQQRTRQAREERTRSVLGEAVKALAADPNTNLKPYVAQLGDVPSAAGDLAQLAENMKTLTFKTDESLKRDLFSQVWEDPTFDEHRVLSWLKLGKLETQDAAWLIGQINSRDSALRSGAGSDDKVFNDFQFENTLRTLESSFIDPITKAIPADKADAARYAKAMLMQRWAAFRMGEGASAGIQDRGKWLVEATDAIVEFTSGGNRLTVKDTPKPVLTQTDWRKEPVLREQDVPRVREELKSGALSDYTASLFRLHGITTAEQMAEFLGVQMRLVKPKKAATSEPKKP